MLGAPHPALVRSVTTASTDAQNQGLGRAGAAEGVAGAATSPSTEPACDPARRPVPNHVAIARTFVKKGALVSADVNTKIIQQLYEAFGRGDLDAILDAVADDVDWATDISSVAAPWYGVPRDPRQTKSASNSLSGRLAELQNRLATSPGVGSRTWKFAEWGLLECAGPTCNRRPRRQRYVAARARFS